MPHLKSFRSERNMDLCADNGRSFSGKTLVITETNLVK